MTNNMNDMKIVGKTSQKEAFAVSANRKFFINEILAIVDEGNRIYAEVIETQSVNQFIPLSDDHSQIIDAETIQSLQAIGYNVNDTELNIAKMRTLTELRKPVQTGAEVVVPEFSEIKHLLIKNEAGMNIGMIQSTQQLVDGMPDRLKEKGIVLRENQPPEVYNGVPFLFDYKKLSEYPHFGIFGGSGSGKSYGARVIEEEMMLNRLPTIVADPHNEKNYDEVGQGVTSQYQHDFAGRYEILEIGEDVGIPFNELTTGEFIKLLSASSQELSENMESAIGHLHKNGNIGSIENFSGKVNSLAYALENKDSITRKVQEGSASQKDKVAFELLLEYENKCNYAAVKGIQWRVHSLMRFKVFSQDSSKALDAMKSRKLIVLRGSIDTLKLYLSFLISKIYTLRRNYVDARVRNKGEEYFPPFFVIADEAHNFAPKSIDAPTKSIIKEIAQEGRKYGVFLGLATQRPALLDDTVMAQLSTKFLFRTVRGQDIQSLAEETDLTTEDTKRLPYLPSGDCFVSSAIMGRTLSIRVRAALTKSPNTVNPFDELDELNDVSNSLLANFISENFDKVTNHMEVMKEYQNKFVGNSVTGQEIRTTLEMLVESHSWRKVDSPFGAIYEKNN